ncbi:MAG: branched-chain amino acid ABC transporter permease [Steroidobacteraceae bacterium]
MKGWRHFSVMQRQWLAVVPLLVLIWAAPLLMNAYWLQFAYRGLQLLALATAWNLLAGYGGQVSLGTAAFVGLGAYAMSWLVNQWQLSYLWVLPLSALVAAAFALLVSPGMFRMRGLYFTIGSLALSEALRILMVNSRLFGGTRGIIVDAPPPSFVELYLSAAVIALLTHMIVRHILSRPAALALQAVRDDEDVARQMGVRSFSVKLNAFVLSAAVMGAVGGLQAMKLGAIEPYGAFSLSWTIDTTAVVIIGGMGTLWGPLLGTLVYVGLSELLRGLPELHMAITGVFLLLTIRFAPSGLAGELTKRLHRRQAS